MDNIRFYIPDGVTVPTRLRLKVGDIDVYYERIHSGFRFEIYTQDEKEALKIAEQVAQRMRSEQGEPEHGVTWVTVSMRVIEQDNALYSISKLVDWKYRVRDSY